jgi:hypothetical protein
VPRFLKAQAHSRHATDREVDAREVDAAELVEDDGSYDVPDLDTVLQRDSSEVDPGRVVVPVRLVGSIPVPVDNIPLRLGGIGTRNLTTTPVQIVPDDLRRGALVLVCSASVRIARTQAEADDASTSFLLSSSFGPWRFHFVDGIWARAVTGTATLGFVVESWAR